MRYLIILLIGFSLLLGAEYQVDQTKANLVKFISDAPIEDFEGVTSQIDGYIYWEGSDLTNKSDIYFEVDLNTLDTGIGLRNRHMRENYLETDQFPKASFKGKIVKADTMQADSFQVQVQGTMSIHGVDRQMDVNGTIKKMNGSLRIRTQFVVKLSDHNIKIPSIMFYKIDENMDVILDFFVKQVTEEN